MVSGVIFHVLLVVAALALAALVAAPLRKSSPRAFAALVLVTPLLAVALYRIVGTPAAFDADTVATTASAQDAPTMEQAVAELEATLARDPAQPEGWRLLARAHASLGNHTKARDAYMTALQHIPDDPELLVEAAQSRAQAEPGNRFDDEALAMLRKALVLDPASQRAQWFIGVVQRQRGEDAAAVATWEALLPVVDASTAAALRVQINEARTAAGMALLPATPAATAPATAAPGADATPASATPAASGGIRVRVSLDPDFAARARLRGDAVVFVIARAAGGPPMPVAVERHTVQDLPLDIVLDDSDNLMPTASLSSLPDVELVARISASGSANRGEGDLESPAVQVKQPASGPVELVIGAPSP